MRSYLNSSIFMSIINNSISDRYSKFILFFIAIKNVM